MYDIEKLLTTELKSTAKHGNVKRKLGQLWSSHIVVGFGINITFLILACLTGCSA